MNIIHELLKIKTAEVDAAEKAFEVDQIFGEHDTYWYTDLGDEVQELANQTTKSDDEFNRFADLAERMDTLIEKVELLAQMSQDDQAKYWYLRNQMGSGWTHEVTVSKMEDCNVYQQSKGDWAQDYMEDIYGTDPFEPLGCNINWEGVYDDICQGGNVDSFEFGGIDYIIDGIAGV